MSKPIVTGIFEGFRVLVDPDDESRKPGPVTVYAMTNEQREKYMSEGKDKKMSEEKKIETAETAEAETEAAEAVTRIKLLKATVTNMAAVGKTETEILNFFQPEYPHVRESLLRAKIALYLHGTKPKEAKDTDTAEAAGTAAAYKRGAYTSSIAYAPETATQRLMPTEFYSGSLKFMRYTIHNGIIAIIRDNLDNSTRETLKLRETELDTLAADLMALIDTLAMYNTAAKQEAGK